MELNQSPLNNPPKKGKLHKSEIYLDFDGEAKRLEGLYGIQNPPNHVLWADGVWYVDNMTLDDWVAERRQMAIAFKVSDEKTLIKSQDGIWLKDGEKVWDTSFDNPKHDDDAHPQSDQYSGRH